MYMLFMVERVGPHEPSGVQGLHPSQRTNMGCTVLFSSSWSRQGAVHAALTSIPGCVAW